MQHQKYAIYLILLLSLSTSCTGRVSNLSDNTAKSEQTYTDGYYYAEVKYYNPKTETRSTYTLRVRVKDNKLVTLYFPNGGWLDDTHFTPPDISTGKASFTTDRNYHYEACIIINVSSNEKERVENDTYYH